MEPISHDVLGWNPLDRRASALRTPSPPTRRRTRDWLATATLLLVIAGVLLPFTSTSASTLPGAGLIAQWSRSYSVTTYQETNTRIKYHGRWITGTNTRYLGRKVRYSNQTGSKATLTFTGTAISWIGPVGPTRGKANVYLNGRLVKTVNTYASHFKPAQVLFTATFSTMAKRTLTLKVLGTKHHPTVALDAFVVRGSKHGGAPPVGPPPAQSQGRVVQLGPSATAAQIEAVIKDNSVDTLELLPGTYTPGRQVYVNVDRTRHLLIHPKTPGTVVFKNGSRPAFYIGLGSDGGWPANARGGNVTIDDLIFDGYHMGPDGIIWTGNCHDITLTHITVRNSTGQGDTSWALYVSSSGGRGTTNLVANYWNVDGGNRTLGAMQSYHNPNADGIVLHHWTVKNAVYAIYAQSDATGLDIDDWAITSSGSGSLSVVIWNVSGVIKNVHATNSGAPSIRSPMVDGGGNSWH